MCLSNQDTFSKHPDRTTRPPSDAAAAADDADADAADAADAADDDDADAADAADDDSAARSATDPSA